MSITMRQGLEADFEPENMVSGEIAITTDTGNLYYRAGNEVHRAIKAEEYNLYFKKGDTLTLTQYQMIFGHITGSARQMQLMLPLPKPIAADVTSITISSNFQARTYKGYVDNVATTNQPITAFGAVTCQKCESGLRINIVKSTAFANADNNTVCVGTLYNGAVITFS